VTSFVNRRAELSAVRRLLSAARLVTLTGVAGVGKTRLALAAGADVRRAFPDGVWLVELAHLRDEALLAYTVAHALGIHEVAGDPLGSLIDFIRPRCVLLVLDNCEHLIDVCTALVGTLLAAAADVRVLATSREVLRLTGEHELRVAPLTVPADAGAGREAVGHHAVELFTQRACAVAPAFRLDDGNRADVEDVCRRLEGIPLAIELAAVRLRVLSIQQLRTRLDDRFHLLNRGSRAALPHHQTLRAAVDWSFELCDHAERTLWERVSMFGGDFDLRAVEEIYSALGDARGAPGAGPVVDVVDGLVAKSVLNAEEHHGRVWYRMLDTLREYGRQRLHASGEEIRVGQAYSQRYLWLAERAELEWFGPGQIDWARLLHREHANIRVALQNLLDVHATEDALRLCAAIWFHWLFSGWVAEGRLWLSRALAGPAHSTRAEAKALYLAAILASHDGDLHTADRLAGEARELAERLGDQVIAAQALTRLSAVLLYRGEAAPARALITDALARLEAAGAADSPHAVLARNILAGARLQEGDLAASVQIYRKSITRCQANGDTTLLTATLVQLARAEWMAGELSDAAEHVRTSVGLQCARPIPPLLAHAVELMAWITADLGHRPDLRRAAMLLGAADRIWRDFGLSKLREAAYNQNPHQRCETRIRAGLGDTTFLAVFARGADMQMTDICLSITGTGAAKPPTAGPDYAEPFAGLTTRELEVAALIAAGLSNRQIAVKLVVSTRTAESHVQNILTKLGFTSRAQVASHLAANRQPDGLAKARTAHESASLSDSGR
jgi:predicted ATPase/DNA-binding NarL/FixJ family response regulator